MKELQQLIRLDEAINEYNAAQANLFNLQQQLAEIENTSSPEIIQQENAILDAQITLNEPGS